MFFTLYTPLFRVLFLGAYYCIYYLHILSVNLSPLLRVFNTIYKLNTQIYTEIVLENTAPPNLSFMSVLCRDGL